MDTIYLTHCPHCFHETHLVIPCHSSHCISLAHFFPNAPYMLTDLQDLPRAQAGRCSLWYDVLIVV
ncbi:MAG: DUF1361 domain-containing protein [Anaerolineales bacterium]|nr:DUF1361 domain-containing protein [Anaerolineales bacterium]